MGPPSLASWCVSVRVRAGWDRDPGAICSLVMATEAFRCGTWQLQWIQLTKEKRGRERVRKQRGLANFHVFTGGGRNLAIVCWHTLLTHVALKDHLLFFDEILFILKLLLVCNRYRWAYRGGAAAALGPVWFEHLPLCYPKYKPRPLCAAPHKTQRVLLQVRKFTEHGIGTNLTLSLYMHVFTA